MEIREEAKHLRTRLAKGFRQKTDDWKSGASAMIRKKADSPVKNKDIKSELLMPFQDVLAIYEFHLCSFGGTQITPQTIGSQNMGLKHRRPLPYSMELPTCSNFDF